ncbi:DUF5799 family protein [Halomicrobium salinisoli]|uniref:DUF5799 family protein n=1 Tax=Halomicrobium salinisoli TaxID=2878391 RepID=UPI001CF03A09|nr:DUF5799 family protein [Halomicrobium salinisoli]
MADDWTSSIAAERMELDSEFNDRVEASSFSNQQWNLVMTAIELEIEDPGDPETARIVPDTSSLPTIMPELDRVEQQSMMGGAGGDGGGGGGSGGGGLLGGVKDALGLGSGGGDDERIGEAEQLAEQYCERLQEKLESSGRWEGVRRRAAGDPSE